MNAHSVVVTWALPPPAFLLKRISSQVELLEMGASLNTLTNTVQLCNTHTHTQFLDLEHQVFAEFVSVHML